MTTALPIQHKPFCLEHAKAGAPIATREGITVDILKWDRAGALSIVGIINDSVQTVMAWNMSGENANSPDVHLVMTPIGFINGKPVFWDSEIQHPDGTPVAGHVGAFYGLENYRWPAPAKVYPTTSMTFDELAIAHNSQLDNKPNEFARSVRAVANAALRHAIDAGQVMDPKVAKQLLTLVVNGVRLRVEHLEIVGDQVVAHAMDDRRAARDMAIAKAVSEATRVYMNQVYNDLTIDAIDLATIIAGVKP